MNKNKLIDLQDGFKTAYIDQSYSSNLAYKPQFISNDYKNGKKVLATLEDELRNCDEFSISVAFLTMGGITPLLQTLKYLEEKGIEGKILTTDYLMFSDPKAIEKLQELRNISIKIYRTKGGAGFHTKGYIFRSAEIYSILIGSSNMTRDALTVNKEWNNKIVTTKDGEVTKEILKEFKDLWESENAIIAADYIGEYKREYNIIKEQKRIAKEVEMPSIAQYKLKPNSMQLSFIKNLSELRATGENRALLLSATGTGKTYAAAFALRELGVKKALFVVHREQIAKQAIKSFRNVFARTVKMGLLSGTSKEYDCDFLFATMQMISKQEVYKRFSKDEFEVVIIDEVHRIGSNSYQKIMNHFEPDLYLGMTASPERTDEFDIFRLFHYNIACEIRLQQALEEDMLCPFHYFGITDLELAGQSIDDESRLRNFAALVSNDRMNHIIEKAEYFGYSGDRVKGLVFCSRKTEARELSNQFNQRGYRTVFLCGDDSQERREEVIDRLTNDDRDDVIDYVFTVDIFNEGVDIPEINQVIMLRPTESPIVFVQQLGRGLRKSEDKEYVVILDFIGNYTNNFMIPIALSGDRSYNKDNIRRYVISGNNTMAGASTIHFDEISKEKIFTSIDKLSGIRTVIKNSYVVLKNKLGRIPYLYDFYQNGEIDPLVIIKEYKSYNNFLELIEKNNYKNAITDKERNVLEYLSKTILSGLRPYELEILSVFLEKDELKVADIQNKIKIKYGYQMDMKSFQNAISVLKGSFVVNESEYRKYQEIDILEYDERAAVKRMTSFGEKIQNDEFLKQIKDIVKVGLSKYGEKNKKILNDGSDFVLYEKYSRRDICMLMNCEKDLSSTMYGMKRMESDVFLFVTYHKAESNENNSYVDGKPDYADSFEDNMFFRWDSQMGRGIDSTYVDDVCSTERKHLFVKKSDAELNFYYLGQFDVVEKKSSTKKDNKGKERDITKFRMRMHHSVRDDVLCYLESKIK